MSGDGDCSIKVYQSFSLTYSLTGKDFQYTEIIPIMLALCFQVPIMLKIMPA